MGRSRFGLALLLMVCWGGFSSAHADDVHAAKTHFDEAQKHFAVGEFQAAAEEYQLAYKAKPDAALLYDAAQAFRLANEPERAIVLYRNYLQFYPDQPNANDVRILIEQLRQNIAAQRAQQTPPQDASKPAPQKESTQLAPPASGNAAVVAKGRPRRQTTPAYKKWWLWTIVGVVVVGAAVGVAVALTTPSHPWANGPTLGPGATSSALSSLRGLEVRW